MPDGSFIDFNDANPQPPENDTNPQGRYRYVRTDDARRMVEGREAEIIRALGISWDGRSGHIRCPYRNHDDRNPSWRLTDDGRAVCTCRPLHSVFDVISEIEGCDFEAAKIRAAEIIGGMPIRPKVNGETNGHHRDDDWQNDVAFIKQGCVPIAGTLGQVYLQSRGLDLPDCPDLLFHGSLTDYGAKRGRPGIVAVIRDPVTGAETGGIHRTYLADDGTAKADMAKAKMMRGPRPCGLIRWR
jgi:hypothetical protein